MFLLELLMRFDAVLAHTQYDDVFLFKLVGYVSELDSLASAAWRSVFRVEIEDHLLASIIAQRHCISIICLQSEIRCLFSFTNQVRSRLASEFAS